MVYLIVCDEQNTCKIGYTSKTANSRLAQLKTSSPYDLRLHSFIDGTQQTEREIHERFSHLRIKREWFNFTDEIANYFEKCKQTFKSNTFVDIVIQGKSHKLNAKQFYSYLLTFTVENQEFNQFHNTCLEYCFSSVLDDRQNEVVNPVQHMANIAYSENDDVWGAFMLHNEFNALHEPYVDLVESALLYERMAKNRIARH